MAANAFEYQRTNRVMVADGQCDNRHIGRAYLGVIRTNANRRKRSAGSSTPSRSRRTGGSPRRQARNQRRRKRHRDFPIRMLAGRPIHVPGDRGVNSGAAKLALMLFQRGRTAHHHDLVPHRIGCAQFDRSSFRWHSTWRAHRYSHTDHTIGRRDRRRICRNLNPLSHTDRTI